MVLQFAEQALPVAMRLAEQSSARLHLGLVHVPVPGWFTAAELAITSPMLEEEVRRREEVYLGGAAAG